MLTRSQTKNLQKQLSDDQTAPPLQNQQQIPPTINPNMTLRTPPRTTSPQGTSKQTQQQIANNTQETINLDLIRRMEELDERERVLNRRDAENTQRLGQIQTSMISSEINNLNKTNYPNSHYSIKLPPFSTSDTEMWFVQAEAVFERCKVETEAATAQVVITQVDSETLCCVRHIVMASPKPNNVYSQIKSNLISHYATSKEARVLQLVRGDILVSGKPSHTLSKLRSLNYDDCNDDFLKQIFLSKLPHQHQLVLAYCNNLSLNELAE